MSQVHLPTLTAILTAYPTLATDPGAALRIDNKPFMYLAVENIGAGPRGLPALSVAHYGEQSGDLMRDPEMCFEMTTGVFLPYYFRNDYIGCEQTSVETTGTAQSKIDSLLLNGQCEFARIWDKTLHDQGFIAALAWATFTPA